MIKIVCPSVGHSLIFFDQKNIRTMDGNATIISVSTFIHCLLFVKSLHQFNKLLFLLTHLLTSLSFLPV